MIEHVVPETLPLFRRRICREPYLGSQIETILETDGDCELKDLYLSQKAAVCLRGRQALAVGEMEDEWSLFFQFLGVEEVKSRCEQPALRGWKEEALCLLHAGKNAGGAAKKECPDGTLDLWELAGSGLLGKTDADAWYADACRRKNRGLADILAVKRDGRYVSTAGVYSLRPQSAYITAVATAPDFRGRGLAQSLVQQLCSKYAGRLVWLICRPELCGFYAKCGFEKAGSILQWTKE